MESIPSRFQRENRQGWFREPDYRYQERICRTIKKCTVLCYILVRIFFGFITFLQIPSDLVVRYQAVDIVGVILSFI
jgi:hypothetical protein